MKEIEYIKDSDFKKLTKKQKLALPEYSNYEEMEIDGLVIIPTNTKSDGYYLGQFFAHSKEKGWWKPMTYDCWKINTEIDNPATIRYNIMRGDFENGGFNIFTFVDEFHRAYISYGGQITIKKKV